MNKKMPRVLIISESYPYSSNEEQRADVLVVIYYNNYDAVENGEVFDKDIISIDPYFIVKKNRYGWQDENIHIPLELLPKFLKNPSGKLDWI